MHQMLVDRASVERNDKNTGGKMQLGDAGEVEDALPQGCTALE